MQGYNFGYLHAECIPHEQALKYYPDIDVMLEQFVIGWFGAQAIECMFMRKVVVAYLHPDDLLQVPPEMIEGLPIISASPDKLDKVLIDIINGKYDLAHIGEMGRQFVIRQNDPLKIATKLIKDYESVKGGK